MRSVLFTTMTHARPPATIALASCFTWRVAGRVASRTRTTTSERSIAASERATAMRSIASRRVREDRAARAARRRMPAVARRTTAPYVSWGTALSARVVVRDERFRAHDDLLAAEDSVEE